VTDNPLDCREVVADPSPGYLGAVDRLPGFSILALLVLCAAWFLAGIGWGLPSRAADPFLFGGRKPWTGAEILALTGGGDGDANRAADVDANPVDRSRTFIVNATDPQRAEIVRRYRLFSHQPDEMNTFMALKEMRPGEFDLDPKLYKYGGLWVYPVAAILKLGARCGLIDVRADLAYYLDHPEAFARFYVAARLYTVAWALIGVWTIRHIATKATGDQRIGAVAAVCFAVMPAVVNAAHEAKPHLPGVVLTLLTVIAAARYARLGTKRSAVLMGLAAGAAVGMVPSMLPVLLVLPVAVLLRGDTWRRRLARCAAAGLVAAGVFVVTNPYVPINALRRPEVLRSHFANSADFYHAGGGTSAISNAVALIGAGTSPLLATAGVVGVIAMVIAAVRQERMVRGPGPVYAWLLAVPAVFALGPYVAFAAGQPGDYGRFALLPDVALALAAVCGVGQFVRTPWLRPLLLVVLLASATAAGACYTIGFVRDSGPNASRLAAAERLRDLQKSGFARVIVTPIEPAPFSVPPVDLFRSVIVLPPKDARQPAVPFDGAYVRPVDLPDFTFDGGAFFVTGGQPPRWLARLGGVRATRLSWADKPFEAVAPAGGTGG
jgi:hypothetical protein